MIKFTLHLFLVSLFLRLFIFHLNFLNISKNISLISIKHRKLFIANFSTLIPIKYIKHSSIVLYRQHYWRIMTALDKLFKTNLTIKVDIKSFECWSVILKLLFNSLMNSSYNRLDLNLLFDAVSWVRVVFFKSNGRVPLYTLMHQSWIVWLVLCSEGTLIKDLL